MQVSVKSEDNLSVLRTGFGDVRFESSAPHHRAGGGLFDVDLLIYRDGEKVSGVGRSTSSGLQKYYLRTVLTKKYRSTSLCCVVVIDADVLCRNTTNT